MLKRWLDHATANEVSEGFVGQWNQLISTTNWKKERSFWNGGKPSSRLKHLRHRIATRLGQSGWRSYLAARRAASKGLRTIRKQSEDLSQALLSHFLAASDWDDAELWLEGATQSQWSISEMRDARWKATGAQPETRPRNEELAGNMVDEDYVPISEVESGQDEEEKERLGSTGPLYEGPDFGEEAEASKDSLSEEDDDVPFEVEEDGVREPIVNPFAGLPALPTDVAEALEQFKLAVVRHRASKWTEISQESMLSVVDALRVFVQNRAE